MPSLNPKLTLRPTKDDLEMFHAIRKYHNLKTPIEVLRKIMGDHCRRTPELRSMLQKNDAGEKNPNSG